MNTLFIISIFVSLFSLALTLIGIPAQIVKNYKEKSSGQPLLTILIAIGFYISQIIFFAFTHAYLPLISFTIGLIMWSITLVQYLLYHKKINGYKNTLRR
jgi:hypothetical protein